MLHELHIQNYAVVDNLALEFYPGLNLLSGETGSGKSILVGALGLALGGRASPDIIRTGADRASITAVFRLMPTTGNGRGAARRRAQPENIPWSSWFEEYGLAGGEEPEIILRRELQGNGKSRLLVNDQPVTAAAVRELARQLVEVHGQNEHVALFSREAQLELLDQFGGFEEAREQLGRQFQRRGELEREMDSLNRNEQERLQEIDLLTFQVQEIERARLQPGADALLENETQVLANLQKIRAAATSAFSQLYEDEDSACSRLAGVSRALDELRGYDARFEPYGESLAGSRATLEDLAFFLRDYVGRLEADPGRLEEVQDRLALIARLKRKYGSSIEEILRFSEHSQDRLTKLVHADERRNELRLDLDRAMAEYQAAAQELSAKRKSAARKLAPLVRDELAQLGMEKTCFELHFATPQAQQKPGSGAATMAAAQSPGGPAGLDEVELLISPNLGEEPRPLEKIASGGELSRLMLALKTVVGTARLGAEEPGGGAASSRATPRAGPTFIFDEVDAGIGGRVAEHVGRRLKRLSCDAQVLCVTHLPQIACFADHHFYVEKLQRNGRTVTAVKRLETHGARAQELARMLSGSQITDAVLKHASAMLKQAEAPW